MSSGDYDSIPFHGVERADFDGLGVTVTFKSGVKFKATPPNKEEYTKLKNCFYKNLGEDSIFIEDGDNE